MTATYDVARASRALRSRWPTLFGIVLAGLVGFDLSEGADLAPALPAMAIIYLGAAALRKPGAAWPLFPAALLVISASEALGGDATWVFIGLAVPLLGYALLSPATRADRSVLGQAIAMIGFGAAGIAALAFSPDVGAYLVAAALVGHVAWDAYHYWANKAVVRSYAEFCLVLDAVLAAIIVMVTVQG